MRTHPQLIIITGHPGTGKTTLGTTLSQELKVPLISKDSFKNRMFNTLGHSDKAWSLKVSAAAHRIMDYVVNELLATGRSVIVESNFKHETDSQRFADMLRKHDATCTQILLQAAGDVIYKRFITRMNDDDRKRHVETVSLQQIKQDLSEPYQPLDIDCQLIELDTTDFASLDIARLAKKLQVYNNSR